MPFLRSHIRLVAVAVSCLVNGEEASLSDIKAGQRVRVVEGLKRARVAAPTAR